MWFSFFERDHQHRPGAWRGWGIKMRDFSVEHKFIKYKTIFKFSLKPQSRQTAVSGSLFIQNVFFLIINFQGTNSGSRFDFYAFQS
jgi:hypothetical protein